MNPKKIKIVADSSSDVLELNDIPYASVPLTIISGEKQYVDDAALDVIDMVYTLSSTKEKSGTSCPSTGAWIEAFGDAEYVFCFTITNKLSGSYNSARAAKMTYEEMYPDRKVAVIDSLSTGPEMRLFMEKTEELIQKGLDFQQVWDGILEYQKHTGLVFMLESLQNLANNGRVSRLAAKAAGVLGIRAIGRAGDEGDLELLSKVRGSKKSLAAMFETMIQQGLTTGKVRISHCINGVAAKIIQDMVLELFPGSEVQIHPTGGLCSFYAERGGLIIAFERN